MKKPETCDICGKSDNTIQRLSKYIYTCDMCWYLVMNGIKRLSPSEEDRLTKLELERAKEWGDFS